MGFHVEINSILRSDDAYDLKRGKELPFRKEGSRIFFDDLPIWLTRSDWTALAEIRVTSQSRTPQSIEGTFRVLHVYEGDEQQRLTVAFRRMFAAGTDPFIYLLMNPDDYERATAAGIWAPESLQTEKFIHASPADQLNRVANKHYVQFNSIRVVVLRSDRIDAEVRWEPATGGLYPHIYGPLNMNAAEHVFVAAKGADGRYSITLPAF